MNTQLGKIIHSDFKEFIANKCGRKRQEVLVGPQFGVDVAIVGLANGLAMAMASDPLSLIPSLGLKESAWLSVQLAANDIATTGFAPMYGQFVLNLPANFSKKDFQVYWDYIHQFSSELGIAITGGHTGFIEGQNSTIAGSATFIAVAKENELLTAKSAKVGDAILLTKGCAISSAAILAKSFPKTVKNRAGRENYHKACESFYDISVVKDGLLAVKESNGVSAMHDVTEGGVLGAIYEMAVASGNGAIIDSEKLPIRETQSKICEVFHIDPRYSIGAGAMVISCKKDAVSQVMHQLENHHIPCTEVGTFTENDTGIKLITEGNATDVIYNQKDPYWGAFFKALQLGWK